MEPELALIALGPAVGVAAAMAGAWVARGWARDIGAPLDPGPPKARVLGLLDRLGVFCAAGAGLIVAGAAVWAWDGWRLAIAALLGFAFIGASVIDLRLRLLPDLTTFAAVMTGLGFAYASADARGFLWALAGALLCASAFLAVGFVFRRILDREALGLGDIKLAAAGGALLGPINVWLAVSAGAAATAILAVALAAARGRKIERGLELPFGPGLMAAFWLAWCVQSAITGGRPM